mmetsp:Transcript_115500/g.333667  ORF Transcript_115500/g.333667 Transcript_115500/m.333667 type:complete len:289 (-) Transcript_115500:19-885(-)
MAGYGPVKVAPSSSRYDPYAPPADEALLQGELGDEAAPGEICQFFAKSGWCKFDDQCRFAHIGEPKEQEVCQFFARAGWCKWGDACKYAHAGGPTSAMGRPPLAALPSSGRQLTTAATTVCKFFASPGGCRNGENCPFQHTGEPGEPEVCQFFQRSGWCKWADTCKYLHAGGPADLAPSAAPPRSATPTLDFGISGGGVSGEPCQFFAKAGWCKWGDGCRYQHVPSELGEAMPPSPAAALTEDGQEVCKFFAKSAWCKWGDGCRYAHVAADSGLVSSDDTGELSGLAL